jgi:hypothetical protein
MRRQSTAARSAGDRRVDAGRHGRFAWLLVVGLALVGASAALPRRAEASAGASDIVVVEMGTAPSWSGVPEPVDLVDVLIDNSGQGGWALGSDGGVFTLGRASFFGSLAGALSAPAVALVPYRDRYAMVDRLGVVWDPQRRVVVQRLSVRGSVVAASVIRFGGRLGAAVLSDVGDVVTVGDVSIVEVRPLVSLDAVAVAVVEGGGGTVVIRRTGEVMTFGRAGAIVDRVDGPLVVDVLVNGSSVEAVRRDGSVVDLRSGRMVGQPRCSDRAVVASAGSSTAGWLLTSRPRPAVTTGLHPLDQLDAEHTALVDRVRTRQGCQAVKAPTWGADPLRGSRVTSAYGWRTHPVYGRRQFHRGIDLARGSTDIRAMAAGVVIEVSSLVGYGTVVVVDHGGQHATVVAHLARATVRVGDTVRAGSRLGVVGATGFATGPHLHVEVRVSGDVIDPTAIVRSVRGR